MKKKQVKPLPCPFCGSDPVVTRINKDVYQVMCMDWGCDVNPTLGPVWDDKESAVKTWNKRR